jgi:pimeloyl-ACP methyl ester carboxylesterase
LRPDGYQDPPSRPLTAIPNKEIGAVLIQGLGSTSDPTDQEHFYIDDIATLLDELDIPYVVFSYKGQKDLNYRPWDTKVNIASIAEELTPFVLAFKDGRVLLIAHSQGGNLAAFWACHYANDALLEHIAGAFFLASPLIQPKPPAFLHGQQKPRFWLGAVNDYTMDLSELSSRLQRKFVIIRYWGDRAAPATYSSFLDLGRSKAPFSETIIREAKHNEICGHPLTLDVIRRSVHSML